MDFTRRQETTSRFDIDSQPVSGLTLAPSGFHCWDGISTPQTVRRGSIPRGVSMTNPFARDTDVSAPGHTIGGIDSALDSLLDELKVSPSDRPRVAAGDFNGLKPAQVSVLCAWYAESCGLHVSDVCAFKADGTLKPYVKASGIMRLARDRVQSIEHGSPQFIGAKTVLVECVVTLKDGTRWHDMASREMTDSRSIMACCTAATVRAVRLAVGIPLPSDME